MSEPSSVPVTAWGWNSTTSWFGHTGRIGGQQHTYTHSWLVLYISWTSLLSFHIFIFPLQKSRLKQNWSLKIYMIISCYKCKSWNIFPCSFYHSVSWYSVTRRHHYGNICLKQKKWGLKEIHSSSTWLITIPIMNKFINVDLTSVKLCGRNVSFF